MRIVSVSAVVVVGYTSGDILKQVIIQQKLVKLIWTAFNRTDTSYESMAIICILLWGSRNSQYRILYRGANDRRKNTMELFSLSYSSKLNMRIDERISKAF